MTAATAQRPSGRIGVLIVTPHDVATVRSIAFDDAASVHVDVERATGQAATRQALVRPDFDVVVLDLGASRLGQAIIDDLARLAPGTPWIVVADPGQAMDESTCLRAGAQEYVVATSDRVNNLGRAIVRAIDRHHVRRTLIESYEQANEAIATLVATDNGSTRAELREVIDASLVANNLELRRQLDEAEARHRDAAYRTAHDLARPVREIKALAAALRKAGASAMLSAGASLTQIDEHCQHSLRFIEDLLGRARAANTRSSEAVDLNVVLKHVSFLMRSEIRRTQTRLEASNLPTVAGSRTALTRLFQNLVDNAIKYAGAGPPQIQITGELVDDHWRIVVADNGPGISAEQRRRVFRPLERLVDDTDEREGTGLGLASCQAIVEQHDGGIWIEDADLGGTAVVVRLPASAW